MGRGSVQLTFSKRRVGLFKKAHEISVLCGANVALIIFSSKGNLYEYATNSGMERILERYTRNSYVEKAFPIKEPESQEDLCHEYEELKRKVDALQRSRRHVMGENLDTLSLTELQQLELQLETALKHIRSQMNQLLLDSIAELQRKEKSLLENKIVLENKIIENNNAITMAQQMQAKEQGRDQASSSRPPTLLLLNSLTTTLPSWMLRPPS
ncbi:hypothetical protein IEQ34_003659 [Dendrobium chrysotoxum]|uniref:Uncharacterized protein n=1 Tax=Dendrobium chrysotoxum TaxID=161865 RepID=A0AAV7HBZ4_DENCH|nr:hypothetical protein IEQ34_003659 [Dendrobium chrysotoxum]